MKEEDFTLLRKHMVAYQIQNRGIKDKSVLNAFRKVPRHQFVGRFQQRFAYNDHPLSIGEGQTISQPYIVALMTEALALEENDKVLEIGTGSGYQTAILAEIAEEVYTIERIASLQEKAKTILDELGYGNVHFLMADGTDGHEEASPYDAILVTAAASEIPQSLLSQLTDTGRMVIPVGGHFFQDLYLLKKRGDRYDKKNLGPVRFVPLMRG